MWEQRSRPWRKLKTRTAGGGHFRGEPLGKLASLGSPECFLIECITFQLGISNQHVCVATGKTITRWSKTQWWDFRCWGWGALGGGQHEPSTCLFLRDGGRAEADGDDGDGSEPAEGKREVEVVEVLQHGRPPVHLPAGRGWVRELQDHAQKPHCQAQHEAPEGSLRREGDRADVQGRGLRKRKAALPQTSPPPAGPRACGSV